MRRVALDLLILIAIAAVLALLLLTAGPTRGACLPEPESQWAPAGFICPPIYGTGWASAWQGPGVARNDCVYQWADCEPITITYRGRSVTVTPSMWCHCYVHAPGPNGETQRIVDLDPATREALGIKGYRLWRVTVEPAKSLPDTSLL